MPYSIYSPPAEAQIAQINAITNKYFDKTLTQVVYESSPMLKRLKSKGKIKVKGGTQIQWPVRVAKLGTSGAVDPRAAVTWSTADTRIAATLGWKFYFGKTLIQWDEILMNQGTPQIISLIKDKLTELKEDMDDTLITALMGTGTTDEMAMRSLNDVIGTTTYAGIDPTGLADATRWRSTVQAATGGALALYSHATDTPMASMINTATFGEMRPTLAVTTQDIFDKMEHVILKEFGQKKIDESTLNLGFDNIVFKGTTFLVDTHCPAGYIFGIDEDCLDIMVHPDYDMKQTEWAPHENYPNALFKGVSWAGNLKFKLRHTSFKYTGVTSVALEVV